MISELSQKIQWLRWFGVKQKRGRIVNIEEKNGILHLGSTAIVLKNVATVIVMIKKYRFAVVEGVVLVNGATVYESNNPEEAVEVKDKILQHLEELNG